MFLWSLLFPVLLQLSAVNRSLHMTLGKEEEEQRQLSLLLRLSLLNCIAESQGYWCMHVIPALQR